VNAFQLAVVDPRVVGIMMLDGYWYRTRWTEPVRLWKRLRAVVGAVDPHGPPSPFQPGQGRKRAACARRHLRDQ
jgi:hypothetical protein